MGFLSLPFFTLVAAFLGPSFVLVASRCPPLLPCNLPTAMAMPRRFLAEKRYPHASGELSSAMLKGAEELPPDSAFGVLVLFRAWQAAWCAS